MSFIAEGHRLWREKIIVDALHTADVQPAPAYAPKLLAAFAAHHSPPPGSPNDSEILQNRKRPASALPAMVLRHLEIMAFDSPPDARKLKDVPSAAEFLAAAEDLFRAILDAFRRRVLHRDISVNNILVADHQLLLVDWEMGRRFQEPSSAAKRGTLTGTLDTMSVASLANTDPLPHDDIESAVYVLLKVLTQTFVPPVDQQRKWATTLDTYCWDDPHVRPEILLSMRISLFSTLPDMRLVPSSSFHSSPFLSLSRVIQSTVLTMTPFSRHSRVSWNRPLPLCALSMRGVLFGAAPKWWIQGRRRFD
ncbi:hypothetical protein B0H15DRAFT_346369 [Mycena belliarum]|uniref:Protein kinase domain-containing protein n=1 Tax=Mycena belliarum TaxID=1033014 RepID=A0AAD6U1H5_9AGAR|nr:hypothetical protein B0H15DRAFT_346369 [Mycena belliae]